jgi:DNA polymerase III subunit delta'
VTYLGHDIAWREWHAALAGPRMHHGWILAGRRGIGKMSFALAAARELVAEPGVRQPAGDHPDIIVLSHLPASTEQEKKRDEGKPFELARNIKVDQIRAMQRRLNTRPTLGSRRAIIIDPADDLEKGASNALLKSLEEPPAGTFFLLVTHRPGRLLATIRSRCRVLRFPQIADGDIDAILCRTAPQADADTRAAAVAAAGGSPGAALDFVELDLGGIHRLMQRIAREGDADFALRGALADAMGARPARERQHAVINLARSVVAAAMRQAERQQLPAIIEAHGELSRITGEAQTHNFDPGLLVMEIGSLLAGSAPHRDPVHG